jgi:hypothetical protein
VGAAAEVAGVEEGMAAEEVMTTKAVADMAEEVTAIRVSSWTFVASRLLTTSLGYGGGRG